MRWTPARDDEDGFTLVELIVVIVLLGIIIVPLTEAFIEGLKTTDTTTKVLVSSVDRQLVATYLLPDIQSSSVVNTSGTGTVCSPNPGGALVLGLGWHQFASAGSPTSTTIVTNYEADYRVLSIGTPASGWELVRVACTGGVTTQTVLAGGLQTSSAVVVTNAASTVSMTITDMLGQTYVISGLRRSP